VPFNADLIKQFVYFISERVEKRSLGGLETDQDFKRQNFLNNLDDHKVLDGLDGSYS